MGLRFDPMGGGQFKQAVQQMIQAESQPIRAMETRKAKENEKLKLLQEFRSKFSGMESALNEMSSFRKFRELKADVGEGVDLASVTIDKDKVNPGKYTIEIEEISGRASFITDSFPDPDAAIFGSGFISFSKGDEDQELYIDEEDASLRGIAKLINQHSELPMRAAVVKDASDPDSSWKLLLSSKDEGTQHSSEAPDFYFYDGESDLSIDDSNDAKNAKISVDNFSLESESNDVVDFLPGVNLHLKKAQPGQPFTLSISDDYQKVSGKLKGLVDNINQILKFIIKQNTIDQSSDTTVTFAGDSTLQTIEYQIRNALHQGYSLDEENSEKKIYMNELGLEFDKAGVLQFKEEKFNQMIESNFDQVAMAITGSKGFASQMRKLFDQHTRLPNSFLNIKERTIQSHIKQIDDQIDQKTAVIDQRKQDLVAKFSRLESTLSRLQQQQQALGAALPGAGGGNMLSQLLGS